MEIVLFFIIFLVMILWMSNLLPPFAFLHIITSFLTHVIGVISLFSSNLSFFLLIKIFFVLDKWPILDKIIIKGIWVSNLSLNYNLACFIYRTQHDIHLINASLNVFTCLALCQRLFMNNIMTHSSLNVIFRSSRKLITFTATTNTFSGKSNLDQ